MHAISIAISLSLAISHAISLALSQDILEPLVLGHSTSLHPVAVLLAIMLFGSVWGVTGMVMAVPMTAVLRIHLEAVSYTHLTLPTILLV